MTDLNGRVPATFDDVKSLRDDMVDVLEEVRAEAKRERALRLLEMRRLENLIESAGTADREWKESVKSQLATQNKHFERLGIAPHSGPVNVVVEPTKLGISAATWRTAFVALIVFMALSPLVACAGYGVARAVTDAGSVPAKEAQR